MMATNCLEYGITVNNVSVLQYAHRKRNRNAHVASRPRVCEPITGAGLGTVPLLGSRGRAPGERSRGEAIRPLKLKAF